MHLLFAIGVRRKFKNTNCPYFQFPKRYNYFFFIWPYRFFHMHEESTWIYVHHFQRQISHCVKVCLKKSTPYPYKLLYLQLLVVELKIDHKPKLHIVLKGNEIANAVLIFLWIYYIWFFIFLHPGIHRSDTLLKATRRSRVIKCCGSRSCVKSYGVKGRVDSIVKRFVS